MADGPRDYRSLSRTHRIQRYLGQVPIDARKNLTVVSVTHEDGSRRNQPSARELAIPGMLAKEPVMDKFRAWLEGQFDEKLVDPNSHTCKLSHVTAFDYLTALLRRPQG